MTKLLDRWPTKRCAVNKKLWLLAAAVVLGVVCSVITWPGIFYSDSYGRWFLAENLANLNLVVMDDWLSVPPQLFMAVLWLITRSYGSFTLVQSVAFFFTAFCAIDFFCPRGKLASGILFAACPVFYGFAVYVEMSVGCVTALLWLLMLVLGLDYDDAKGWRAGKKLLYFIACGFLWFVMLGFRQNAFTVVPVLAVALIVLCRKARLWWPLVMQGVAMALCLAVIPMLPGLLRFGIRNGSGPATVGFLWETVTMLGELDDPDYAHMLDYLGDEDTTRNAVEANNTQSIYGYHQYIPNTVVGERDNAKRIREDYLYLITHETGTYLRVKGGFIARVLGITQPLSAGEYDYDRDGRMAEFGYRDTAARRAFHESYVGFQEAMGVLRRPWVMFLLAGGTLALAWRFMAGRQRWRLLAVYAAAVFFYGAFLINTQSQEFRYFFAPLVLLFITTAGSAGALAAQKAKGVDYNRRRDRKQNQTPEDKA